MRASAVLRVTRGKKRKLRASSKPLLLLGIVVVAMALGSLASFWFVPDTTTISTAATTITRSSTVMVHRPFTILDSSSNNKQANNVLLKPFQWYRDHWYTLPTPDRHDHQHHQQQQKPLWEATQLPAWMKEYFDWHRAQTSSLSDGHGSNNSNKQHNTASKRYLVLQCLEQDRQCGGLADRLLALPFLVLMAAQSRRLLVIVWTVPFPLEEFLMPAGVDWMLPAATATGTGSRGGGDGRDMIVSQDAILSSPSIVDKTVFVRVSSLVAAVQDKSLPVVRARIQDYTSAWEYYDQYHSQLLAANGQGKPRGETVPSFAMQHYRELFFVLFQPSPPFAQALKENAITTITRHPLVDEQRVSPYAVAHYRALYGSQQQQQPSMAYMDAAATNALNCASHLLQGGPVIFLSDSAEAVQRIQRRYIGNKHVLVRSNYTTSAKHPLHLDKAARHRPLQKQSKYEPSDFYDTFLDLFLMANARCVSFGQGGFGKMGSLLSVNRTCTNRHFEYGKMVPCVWKD